MLPNPTNVCLQRLGKFVRTVAKSGWIIEEDEIQPSQRLWYGRIFDPPVQDRSKALVKGGRAR
jgi:hypothetical protein